LFALQYRPFKHESDDVAPAAKEDSLVEDTAARKHLTFKLESQLIGRRSREADGKECSAGIVSIEYPDVGIPPFLQRPVSKGMHCPLQAPSNFKKGI